jgi:drug/metabolite transporter (DMT)-like permease
MRRPVTAFDWMLLATLGIIWGASFYGVELALTGFAPISVAAARVAMAAILLVSVAIIFGDGLPGFDTPTQRRIWLHCLGMGVFTNAIPFSLLSWGQQHVTSGFAGITMAVVPLFVLPLSHFLVPNERMTPARIFGFVFGFFGVVMLVGGDRIFSDASPSLTLFTAQIACVTASICYAIGTIITRLCPPISTVSYAATGLMLGGLLLLPTAYLVEGLPRDVPLPAWYGLIYLALFPTAAATILLTIVIKRAGPSFLSLVNYQVPVWAVIFGAVLLAEALPGHFLSALIIILIGMAISQFYDNWRAKLKSAA